MIILFRVFLVVAFRPDFHPPPFPWPDSICDAFGDVIGQIFGFHGDECYRDTRRNRADRFMEEPYSERA